MTLTKERLDKLKENMLLLGPWCAADLDALLKRNGELEQKLAEAEKVIENVAFALQRPGNPKDKDAQ